MKNKLHILLFCENDTDLLEQKQTGLFAIDLVKKGFEVSILINNCPSASKLETIYDKIKIYYTCPKQKYALTPYNFFKNSIKNVLTQDLSIDIVQVMNVNYSNSYIAKVCSKLDIPCVGRIFHKGLREFRELNQIKKYILRKNLAKFTRLCVNAEYLITIAKKHNLKNITMIYDGIYTTNFKGCFNKTPIRKNLDLPTNCTLLVCTANIARENKQFETLKKMMPLSATRQLVFLGNIEDNIFYQSLKREIEFLDIEKYVHFINGNTNYISYLKAADLFVLMGGIEDRIETILQAQALGVPVILGQSPSSLFLTNANRCGVVLYNENILVDQALDRLLNDSLYRQTRGANARCFVDEIFSRELMIENYSKLYQSL
jgi:glycosyltransferase involved in cell wall biosynthesis